MDGHLDGHLDGPASARARFDRVVRSQQKPKPGLPGRGFHGITSEEKNIRAALVGECAAAGMAAEQIVDFLPTWGVTLQRSQVYDYLAGMKLDRRYRRSEGEQSHHDYFTLRFFVRFAQDAAAAGYRTRRLAKGRAPWEGLRFKPDMKWEVLRYLFYLENQLSDLSETRWRVKFANYHRLAERSRLKFRALFVIDQRGDMNYVRRHAREFLKAKTTHRNLYRFINLNELKRSANLATDPVWLDPWGKGESLLAWLGSPGQNPAAPR